MSRFVLTAILTFVLIMMIVPWVLSGFGGVWPYVAAAIGLVVLLWFIFGPEKKRNGTT